MLALVEGSGYFLVNSSAEEVANLTYLEAESAIQVSEFHHAGRERQLQWPHLTLSFPASPEFFEPSWLGPFESTGCFALSHRHTESCFCSEPGAYYPIKQTRLKPRGFPALSTWLGCRLAGLSSLPLLLLLRLPALLGREGQHCSAPPPQLRGAMVKEKGGSTVAPLQVAARRVGLLSPPPSPFPPFSAESRKFFTMESKAGASGERTRVG